MSKDKIKAALEIALKHIETLMCTPALNQGQEYANRFNDRKLVIDAIAALAQQATVEPVQVIKEQRFAGQSDREAKEVQVSQPVAVYSLEYGHKLETENEALKVERDKLQMDCEALQTAIQNFKAAPDYPAINSNLIGAALGVLRDIECSHRPPIPEFIPCGTMVHVRLSALSELHKEVYGKYAEEGDLYYMYAHKLDAPKE